MGARQPHGALSSGPSGVHRRNPGVGHAGRRRLRADAAGPTSRKASRQARESSKAATSPMRSISRWSNLTSLGYGDIVATGDLLRFLGPLETLIGLGLLTASISWILLLYRVLSDYRSLSHEISLLSDAKQASGTGLASIEAPIAARVLADLTSRVVVVRDDSSTRRSRTTSTRAMHAMRCRYCCRRCSMWSRSARTQDRPRRFGSRQRCCPGRCKTCWPQSRTISSGSRPTVRTTPLPHTAGTICGRRRRRARPATRTERESLSRNYDRQSRGLPGRGQRAAAACLRCHY